MTEDQLEVINTIQPVLRQLALCINGIDGKGRVSSLLVAASEQPNISPMTSEMLLDLAKGCTVIDSVFHPKQ